MSVIRRVALSFVGAVMAFACFTPAIASAQTNPAYFAQVANGLHANPVFVDAAASPTITTAQAAQLDSKIKATGKPMYIVLADNNQAFSAATPDEFLAGIHNALGANSSEVIAVSTSKGFYANGYNLPSAVADGAGAQARLVMSQATANGNKPVPFDVYSNWVANVAKIKVASSGSSSTRTAPAASASHGLSGGAIFLIVLAGLLVIVLIIVAFTVSAKRRRQRANAVQTSKRLNRSIDELNDALLSMSANVTLHPEAEADHTQAMEAVQRATTAVGDNDLVDAQKHLDTAKRHRARAQQLINGVDPDVRTYAAPTRSRTSSASSRTVQDGGARGTRVQSPSGPIVINNTTYAPQQVQTPAYNHWYAGGMYGGRYYGPGFYSDPFWTYEVLMMDAMMLDELNDDRYGYGDRDDRYDGDRDTNAGTTDGGSWGDNGSGGDSGWTDSNVSSGTTDGGSWGSGSSDTTGWGGGSDTSTYSTPDYGSGSGGGSDWGSSGGDSGGWGGDSGGGGSDSSGW